MTNKIGKGREAVLRKEELKVIDMKMISILAATVLLAGSAAASFAQTAYPMDHSRDMGSSAGYAGSSLTTGRSVSVFANPVENCQRGEPSISPNGIAPLDDLGVCQSDMAVSR